MRRMWHLSEASLIFHGVVAVPFSKVDQSHSDHFEGLWIKSQFLFPNVVMGTLSPWLRKRPVLVGSGFLFRPSCWGLSCGRPRCQHPHIPALHPFCRFISVPGNVVDQNLYSTASQYQLIFFMEICVFGFVFFFQCGWQNAYQYLFTH